MSEQETTQEATQEATQETTQENTQQETNPLLNLIPEELKAKPWVQENTKTPEDFFKFVDNQNTLVGKKGIVIPKEGEDNKEFLKAIGVPEAPDAYEFPVEEGKERNAEVDAKIKTLLHESGIPKAAAEKLVAGYEGLLKETAAEKLAAEKAEDEAFAKFNTDFFGDKRDEIVANAQKVLRETVNPAVLPAIDKMTSEQLAVVIAVTEGVFSKYSGEDKFRGGAPGSVPIGGETFEQLSAAQRELMKDPAFKDWRSPEHPALMEKNKVILEKMRAIKK